MKKAFVVLVIALTFVGMVLSPVSVLSAHAASQTSINTAIRNGLAYLALIQNKTDGSWNETATGSYPYATPVANTAMAVLAFENNGHYGWNASDSYHTTVQMGLNYLFSQGQNMSLSNWPTVCAGSPYVGEAKKGAYWSDTTEDDGPVPCYVTPMVLMAIIASNAPKNVTGPGPLGDITYEALANETVSWIAYAQNSNATYMTITWGASYTQQFLGGWRYIAQSGDSDNSVSGWPVVGLLAAELWRISPPNWVGKELAHWTNTDQNMTGTPSTNPDYGAFGYMSPEPDTINAYGILGGVSETAEGILELTYCGYSSTYANITAAEGYLYSDWYVYINQNYWQVNMGSLYSMYGVMKAMRETMPTPTKFITNYYDNASYEWYNGTGQYADALVANQNASGMWINWKNWRESTPGYETYATSLTTALGILILLPAPVVVHYTLRVTVDDDTAIPHVPIVGATVSIVGPQTLSGSTNLAGQIAFNGILAGGYSITTSMPGYITNTTSITLNNNYNLTVSLLRVPSVGGISIATGIGILASYIGLVSAFAVAAVATAVCVRRVKRRK